jgi:Sec-independent protein translocase protein TatA
MDTIGPWEMLIIVLLLGANRLPQAARSLEVGTWEFRCALHESSQPSNPDALQEPDSETPAER